MGIDYRAVVMVGIEFDSLEDVQEYLETRLDPDENCDLEELAEEIGLDWQSFSEYGEGGVLGSFIGLGCLSYTAEGVIESWDICYEKFEKEMHSRIKAHKFVYIF